MKSVVKIILICGFISNLGIGFAQAENSSSKLISKKSGYYLNKNFDLIPNDKSLSKKVVLITIDDGPGKTDKELINILNKHKTKAIFFINGIHDKDFKDNIKMLYDAGFTIGNHTWSHINLKRSKEEVIREEISRNTNLIYKLTGQNPKFFRPPYGAMNSYTKNLVKKEGMIFMNWSGSALDWEKGARNEKIFIKNITKNLHDGEIILLHGHPWSTKYLDNLLTTIEQEGFGFIDPINIIE